MSIEIEVQTWLKPPVILPEKQILKKYEEEITECYRYEPRNLINVATASRMRQELFIKGILDNVENHAIVERAKHNARIYKRVMGPKLCALSEDVIES